MTNVSKATIPDIQKIIREHKIGRDGFVPTCDGWWDDKMEDFANQVAIAEKWLALVKPDPTIPSRNARYGSYRLKHSVEQWTKQHGPRQYVSNSALLVAAIYMGIPVKRRRDGSIGDVLIQRETRWPQNVKPKREGF